MAAVGSYGGGVSYERGTLVNPNCVMLENNLILGIVGLSVLTTYWPESALAS